MRGREGVLEAQEREDEVHRQEWGDGGGTDEDELEARVVFRQLGGLDFGGGDREVPVAGKSALGRMGVSF